MKKLLPILFFNLFLVVSCSKKQDENLSTDNSFAAEKTLLNISYGANNQQIMDLYLPANRSSTTKTLILVHGGGWTSGDKNDMNSLLQLLKQNLPAYAFANINYRLSTSSSPALPMQIDDIALAINNLKTNNYGISNKFGFVGISAGAHLSMLYGYANNSSNEIKIICSIVGPTNFTDPNYLNNPVLSNMYFVVAGQTYANNPAFFQNASPLLKATSTAPPTLLLYGNADPLVPTTQGVDMKNKLTQLGVYNEFTLYNGGHGNWSQPDLLDAYAKIIGFVNNKFN